MENYDKKQCIYGEDSSMDCSLHSTTGVTQISNGAENLDESLKRYFDFLMLL